MHHLMITTLDSCPAYSNNLIFDCNPKEAVEYFRHEDCRMIDKRSHAWTFCELYQINILKKFGDLDFSIPELIPSFLERKLPEYTIEDGNFDSWLFKYKFFVAMMDLGSLYFLVGNTDEQTNEYIEKYCVDKAYVVFEMVKQINVKYSEKS